MNAQTGLERIRDRLMEEGAGPATLRLVNVMIQRASAPEMSSAQASIPQLVRMLVRSEVARNDFSVYNDLVRLEEHVTDEATARAEAQRGLDARPVPKSKKFYKEQREKSQRPGSGN